MVDRAALFTELTQRNAMRKAAHLPLLDLKAELGRATGLAHEREINALAPLYTDELPRLLAEATAELITTHGAAYADSMAGRWTIRRDARLRYEQFLRNIHGHTQPVHDKHPIVYGDKNQK